MIQHLNQHTVANDVRMRRALFPGAFLLVEGRSDQKLYGKFVDKSRCQVLFCRNKVEVFQAIEILNVTHFRGVVGIVDADFDHARKMPIQVNNVFMTDFHDAEIMLLLSPAFEAVVDEFCSHDKLRQWNAANNRPLRDALFAGSAITGCLLWHSLHNQLNLNFDQLKTKAYLDDKTLDVAREKLVQHVKQRSCRPDLSDVDLLAGIVEHQAKCNDIRQIARGHDVIDHLVLALRSAIGSCNVSRVHREVIEVNLRVSFTLDEFKRTQLYQDVVSWAAANPPFHVFI